MWWLGHGIPRRDTLELSLKGVIEVSQVNKTGERGFQVEGSMFKGIEVGVMFEKLRLLCFTHRERW